MSSITSQFNGDSRLSDLIFALAKVPDEDERVRLLREVDFIPFDNNGTPRYEDGLDYWAKVLSNWNGDEAITVAQAFVMWA